ncbi:MAG: DUF4142 domain-containing protein [Acetobacteraceae bacterium]
MHTPRLSLAGLGLLAAAGAAAAQTVPVAPSAGSMTPQEAVRQELEQAGFTDLHIVPGTSVLQATDKAGRLLTVTVSPAPPASVSGSAPAPLTDPGRQFLVAAAQAANYELALSTLALTRATAPSVKQYAQQIIGDHDAIDRALQAIAKPSGVTLPETPSVDQQIQLATFAGLVGSFDHTYLQEMARIETLDKRHFDQAVDEISDAAVKSFAQSFADPAAKRAHEALVLDVTL